MRHGLHRPETCCLRCHRDTVRSDSDLEVRRALFQREFPPDPTNQEERWRRSVRGLVMR